MNNKCQNCGKVIKVGHNAVSMYGTALCIECAAWVRETSAIMESKLAAEMASYGPMTDIEKVRE